MSHPNRVSIIAVGVSAYDRFGHLDGPRTDVANLRRMLVEDENTALFQQSQFKSLSDPTSADVRAALSSFAHDTGAENDVLLFYFSGHAVPVGNRDLALCTKESFVHPNFQRAIPTSMIMIEEVIRVAAAVNADPIFILDTCYSGEAGAIMQMTFDEAKTQVQAKTGSAYVLMSSCTPMQTSADSIDGGAFSKALCEAAAAGDPNVPHSELDVRDLYKLIRSKFEKSEHEMGPMLFVGDTFPTLGIAKNVQYRARRESLQPYMVELMRYLWNDGALRTIQVSDIADIIGKGAYGNHRKLSREPWGLLQGESTTRSLSQRGEQFMRGELTVPKEIEYSGNSWGSASGTALVGLGDY